MEDHRETEKGQEAAMLTEAATYKAQAKRLMRDMAALLADRTVPSALRKEVEDVRMALRKTWKDLAAEEPEEPEIEEPEDDEEPEEEESEEFRDRFQRAMGMMEAFGFEPVELSEPQPNEHAARLNDPGRYEQIRRQNDKLGPGIDVIWGITKDGKTEMQAIRFDKAKFTADEARKWLEDHDMKTIEFEKASEAKDPAPARVKDPEFEKKHPRGEGGQFTSDDDAAASDDGQEDEEPRPTDDDKEPEKPKDKNPPAKEEPKPEDKPKPKQEPPDKPMPKDRPAPKPTPKPETKPPTKEEPKPKGKSAPSGKPGGGMIGTGGRLYQSGKGYLQGLPRDGDLPGLKGANADKAMRLRSQRLKDLQALERATAEKAIGRKLSDAEYEVLSGRQSKPDPEIAKKLAGVLTPEVMSALASVRAAARKVLANTDAESWLKDAKTNTAALVSQMTKEVAANGGTMFAEAQATMADKVSGLKKLIRAKNKLALGMLKGMMKDDDNETWQAVYDAIDDDDWAEASDLLGDVEEAQPVVIVNVFSEAKREDFDWPTLEQRIQAAVRSAFGIKEEEPGEGDGESQAEPAASEVEQAEAAVSEALGESAEGVEVLSEGAIPNDGQGPLTLKVKLIEPGFGNKRDGHYYPAATLSRDAHVFKGAKMYETDHRPEDKNTRTWVSTIRDIVGFSETGAPLAEVVVHDPSFAQRMRNLKQAGMIEQMACSILANGQVRAGEIEGQKARIVEAITDAQAVDWVTRAGAGGQALAIMSEAQTEPDSKEGGTTMAEQQEPAQTNEPVQEKLATDCVASILKEAALPDLATQRLGEREYATEEQLREAIAAEVAYIKEVTGSGQVRDMGGTAKPEPKKPSERLAEKQAALDLIDQRYGLQR